MAAFPTTVATNSDLYIAVNALSTQLTDNPLSNSATTVNVVSTASFPTVGFISIDNEIIKYTGTTGTSFTGCTRGADGTSATSHVQNSQVFHNVIAAHHNALKDDLIATEQFISDLIGRTSTQVRAPDGTAALPSLAFASDTDTGLYKPAANRIGFATNGVARALFSDTGHFAPASDDSYTNGVDGLGWKALYVTNGSASLPSISFSGDADTGLYHIASGAIDFTSNATATVRFQASGIQMIAGIFRNINGTAAAPTYTFDGDEDTGIYHSAANSVGIACNSALKLSITDTGVTATVPFQATDGTAGAPSFTFNNDLDTGIYRNGTNTLSIATGGTERIQIDNLGNLFVQTGHFTMSGGATKQIYGTDGSATTPSHSFGNDTDTGLYSFSANVMGVAVGAGETAQFGVSGTASGTTYTPLKIGQFRNMFDQQHTSGVTTSAVTILTVQDDMAMVVVAGSDNGGANAFIDLLLCSSLNSAAPTVVSSKTVAGSPAARTYTATSSAQKLAMASGTYAINAQSITMHRFNT